VEAALNSALSVLDAVIELSAPPQADARATARNTAEDTTPCFWDLNLMAFFLRQETAVVLEQKGACIRWPEQRPTATRGNASDSSPRTLPAVVYGVLSPQCILPLFGTDVMENVFCAVCYGFAAPPKAGGASIQVWDWAEDGRTYAFSLFLVRQRGGHWEATQQRMVYRALRRAELDAALGAAGFTHIRWYAPEESGFYQPVVTARR
jgi:hypothetical protein